MILRGEFLPAVVLWVGLCGLSLGCGNSESGSSYGPPMGCVVETPCEDDPAKTCTVPCKGQVGAPSGNNVGGGGSGGSSGTGGSGVAVDVAGTIVQLITASFDQTAAYLDAIHVSAVGAETSTVEADAVDGSFFLSGARAGASWLLAEEVSGVGEVFSTYSYQLLDGVTPVTLPVMSVAVLDGVATQLDVDSLAANQAQLVLEISDEANHVLTGVAASPLNQTTVGYDVSTGQFSTLTAGTGELGLALMLNVPVSGSGTMTTVFLTYLDEPYEVQVPIAPNTVTYARVALDTMP